MGKKVPEKSMSGVWPSRNRMLKPESSSRRALRAVTSVAKARQVSTETGRHHSAAQEAKPPKGTATTMNRAAETSPWVATYAQWALRMSLTRAGVASMAW